jgi:hypothetical protein
MICTYLKQTQLQSVSPSLPDIEHVTLEGALHQEDDPPKLENISSMYIPAYQQFRLARCFTVRFHFPSCFGSKKSSSLAC